MWITGASSGIGEATAQVLTEAGAVDILINNAGVMPLAPMLEGRVDEWERMIDVNLKVIANGQLGAPEKAAALIENGEADVITLGKTALANPDWPKRVMEGEPIEAFDFSILQPQVYIKDHEL